VDDIQDIDSKEDIQAEFLRIFTTLHNGSKQLVISPDRALSRLVSIEGRLRTRFRPGPGRGDRRRGERGALAAHLPIAQGMNKPDPPESPGRELATLDDARLPVLKRLCVAFERKVRFPG
jgi:hypothetical protein